MNQAQKYPKKKPLLFSVAQSDMYFPYATNIVASPNPCMKLKISILDHINSSVKHMESSVGSSALSEAGMKVAMKGMHMNAPATIE